MATHKMSVTLIDDYGRTTARSYEMRTQVLLADILIQIGAVVTDLLAVTDLGLVRIDFNLQGVSGSSPEPTAGANVDVGATFTGYIQDGEGKKATHKMPGIIPAAVNDDGTIDLENAAVADWLTNFENGEKMFLSDGEEISAWIKGVLDK